MKVPCAGTHAFQRARGLPVQSKGRSLNIDVTSSDIALPPRGDFLRDSPTRCPFEGTDHFIRAVTPSCAQIQGIPSAVRSEIVQSGHVPFRHIHHMDVVTHPGPVGRRIASPKSLKNSRSPDATCTRYNRKLLKIPLRWSPIRPL